MDTKDLMTGSFEQVARAERGQKLRWGAGLAAQAVVTSESRWVYGRQDMDGEVLGVPGAASPGLAWPHGFHAPQN